jgi:hypothetical protein
MNQFQLDADSRADLVTASDTLFLGVIHPDGLLGLFHAAPQTDLRRRTFAGHRELLAHQQIPPSGCSGFSFEVKNGKLYRFYRISLLNQEFDDFAIPADMMYKVIDALALPQSDDFASFP